MESRVASPSLSLLIRQEIARVDGVFPVEASKAELLAGFSKRHGPAAVVAIGLNARALDAHPFLDVMLAAPDAVALLQRWGRLEGFFHSANYTEVTERSDTHLIVHHLGRDGSPAGWLNDLFVLGLLHNLLLAHGAFGLTLTVGGAVLIGADGDIADASGTRGDSARWTWRWERAGQGRTPRWLAEPAAPLEDVSTRQRVAALVCRDLGRSWTLAAIARTLGASGRTLQRQLKAEGTTLGATVRRARLDVARKLLVQTDLDLTAVAFCCGFYDSAHFSRAFRQDAAVPPSAYRDAAIGSPESP